MELSLADIAKMRRPPNSAQNETYNDRPSLAQLFSMHQQMLQQRGATYTPTIDPGRTWGGLDPLAHEPDDVQSYRFARDYIPGRA